MGITDVLELMAHEVGDPGGEAIPQRHQVVGHFVGHLAWANEEVDGGLLHLG
jgi:hypothetical protein